MRKGMKKEGERRKQSGGQGCVMKVQSFRA